MHKVRTRLATRPARASAFTLIELLTVVAIISLLISILMPSLSRARDQAKAVHCLARLKEFGVGLATYENTWDDFLPPAQSTPTSDKLPAGLEYGWAELLFSAVYLDKVEVEADYPVLRNIDAERWNGYFICKASQYRGVNSGNYRVYLPSWSAASYALEPDGRFGDPTKPDPTKSCSRTYLRPTTVLMGDANERSERGDGLGEDDGSYIGANEANTAGSDGSNGNRFSDRHYGGTNFLFADLHGDWDTKLRDRLAEDWDLNGVDDIDVVP